MPRPGTCLVTSPLEPSNRAAQAVDWRVQDRRPRQPTARFARAALGLAGGRPPAALVAAEAAGRLAEPVSLPANSLIGPAGPARRRLLALGPITPLPLQQDQLRAHSGTKADHEAGRPGG